jgi:hypothetical protein
MVRKSILALSVAVFLTALTACGGGSESGSAPSIPTDVSGAAQKGPFLQGSSVLVNILDDNGNASNLTIVTQTDDSLGNFSFTTHHKGPVQIVTTGYYFNEVTGVLSDGPLTMRGIFNVSANGGQTAYVNILTHLINNRVLNLIADKKHLTVEEAISQAQGELQSAFTPVVSSDSISYFGSLSLYDVEGTDTVNNSYLLVISSAFCQASVDLANANSSSVTSELTLLLNRFADDLAQDGVVDPTLVIEKLQPAITKLDASAINHNLGSYSENVLNITLPTPDISSYVNSNQQNTSCGGGSITYPVFTSDLEIISKSPDSAQSNVPTDASIIIELNKSPETYSWGASDILITDSNDNIVTFTVGSHGPSTIVLDPVFPLLPDNCYIVRLDTGLMFNNDERLVQPFEWSFGTGSHSGVSINSHQNGDLISGTTQLSGTYSDSVTWITVEIKSSPYHSGEALLVSNSDWTFDLDSVQYTDGGVRILVEGFDEQGASTGTTELNLIVDNTSGAHDWVPQGIGTSNSFLFGVQGIGNSVFALGEDATVLEYDGSQWSRLTPAWTMSDDLFGAWGLSADDYYFVGGGTMTTGAILHNKSGQWTNEKNGAFSKIWGTSSENIYTIGSSGVFHFNGSAWSSVDVGYSPYHYRGIWGTDPNDVYIAGFSGPNDVILRYDGATWSNMLEGAGYSNLFIHEIWGTSSDNIYAVGTGKQILHFDGTSWKSVDTGLTLLPLYGIWGFGADDIYVIGSIYPNRSKIYHFDGVQWSEDKVLDGVELYDIWGSAEAGVFAVGGMGQDRQGVVYRLSH